MNNERKKAEHLSQELLSYFFEQEADQLSANIRFERDGTLVSVSGELQKEPENLATFMEKIQVERDPNLEEYYEGLSCLHHQEDYSLLGLMSDWAKVDYVYPKLTIQLFRKNKSKAN